MRRLRFTPLAWAITLGLALASSPALGADAARKPNVALIVLDDMGMADIGPYGGEVPAPNIARLGEAGLVYSNFHTQAACSPTRSMLLTGSDNHRIGLGTMEGNVGPNQKDKPGYETELNEKALPITELLVDAGYHTYHSGKWHLGHGEGGLPIDRGFEESFTLVPGGASHYADRIEYNQKYQQARYVNGRTEIKKLPKEFYSTRAFTNKAIEFIDAHHADGKPFFLYLAYTAPHAPLQVPDQKLVAHYEKIYEVGWDVIRAQRLERMKALGLVPAWAELPPAWEFVKAWDSLTPEEQKMNVRKMAIYAAMIDYVDQSVGRFVDHLKKIGEYENTVFIVMSDNGADHHNTAEGRFKKWIDEAKLDNSYENIGRPGSFTSLPEGWAMAGATPFRGAKGAVSEGGLRNMCQVTYPGVVSSGRTAAFATVADIAPTILDYAGITRPATTYKGREVAPMDGTSMRPLWEGKSARVHAPDEPVLMELYGRTNKALYLGDWKILKLGEEHWGHGEQQPWQLYNLVMDPLEAVDLAAAYPTQLQMMIKLYEQREKEVGFISSKVPGQTQGAEAPAHH